jgi:hypothetical protein
MDPAVSTAFRIEGEDDRSKHLAARGRDFLLLLLESGRIPKLRISMWIL